MFLFSWHFLFFSARVLFHLFSSSFLPLHLYFFFFPIQLCAPKLPLLNYTQHNDSDKNQKRQEQRKKLEQFLATCITRGGKKKKQQDIYSPAPPGERVTYFSIPAQKNQSGERLRAVQNARTPGDTLQSFITRAHKGCQQDRNTAVQYPLHGENGTGFDWKRAPCGLLTRGCHPINKPWEMHHNQTWRSCQTSQLCPYNRQRTGWTNQH